jgi:hypothetical protein
VKRRTGFRVAYGPIQARDIPVFVDAGHRATPEMRLKTFPLSERTVLVPVELVQAFKWTVVLQVVFLLLSGLGGNDGVAADIATSGVLASVALLAALVGGAVMTPLLLPFLPGRAFSLKSLPIGIALSALVVLCFGNGLDAWWSRLEAGAWLLIVPGLTAFLAMNFTGASTYTSLSGVRKEMRAAVPLELGAIAVGIALWVASRVIA